MQWDGIYRTLEMKPNGNLVDHHRGEDHKGKPDGSLQNVLPNSAGA
jgi:hypothetical protein